jgi:endonuclease/exonuclease/phosphatase family metal-dependent hydrolase
MRLVTLNIWEGRCGRDVVDFLSEESKRTDVLCLQEVFRPVSSTDVSAKISSGDLAIDAFGDLKSKLAGFEGRFDAAMQGEDSPPWRAQEQALRGLAIFHRKQANAVDGGNIFVFGDMNQPRDGIAARNLQYVRICNGNKQFLICNFHGLHIPGCKGDSVHRIKQSQNIIRFLARRRQRGEKVILCGDFNVHPNTEAMQMLEASGLRNPNRKLHFKSTRTRLRGTKPMDAPDYVLISSGIVAQKFEIMPAVVSDHAPLSLVFS